MAYVRASSDKQETSCKDQLREIEARAAAEGLELAATFADDGVSGTSLDRPGLRELRAYVAEQGVCGRVYVWHRDRLGRVDARELVALDHELEREGWPVHPLEGAQRTGLPFADALQGLVEGHQAGEFSRDLAAKSLRGQRRRAVEGELRPGGLCPYGFARRVTWPGGAPVVLPRRQKVGRLSEAESAELVPGDPDEVAIVRHLFDAYAAGGTSAELLARQLNERGVPSPKGKRWGASSVRSILRNPAYAGDFAWNRATAAMFRRVRGGELVEREREESGRRARNPRADWIVHRDAHEALVPRATWERAQAVREGRGTASGGGRRVATYALSDLVRCGCCGRAYSGARPNGGKARERYQHSSTDIGCWFRSLLAEELERGTLALLQDLFDMVSPSEWRRRMVAAARRLVPQRGSGLPSGGGRRAAELEAWVEAAVENLGRVQGAAADALARKIGERQAELEELRKRAAPVRVVPVLLDPEQVADDALELVQAVGELGLDLPAHVRRAVYRLVLEAIVPEFERVEREGKRALNRFLGATLRLTPEARGVLLLGSERARVDRQSHESEGTPEAEDTAGVLWLAPAGLKREPRPPRRRGRSRRPRGGAGLRRLGGAR